MTLLYPISFVRSCKPFLHATELYTLFVPLTAVPLLLTNVAFVMSADWEFLISRPFPSPSANNMFHIFIPDSLSFVAALLSTTIPVPLFFLKALLCIFKRLPSLLVDKLTFAFTPTPLWFWNVKPEIVTGLPFVTILSKFLVSPALAGFSMSTEGLLKSCTSVSSAFFVPVQPPTSSIDVIYLAFSSLFTMREKASPLE